MQLKCFYWKYARPLRQDSECFAFTGEQLLLEATPLTLAGPQRFTAPGSVRHPNSGVMALFINSGCFWRQLWWCIEFFCLFNQSSTLQSLVQILLCKILLWKSLEVTGLQEKEFGQKYPQWKLKNVQHWTFHGRFCLPMKRGSKLHPWYLKFLLP